MKRTNTGKPTIDFLQDIAKLIDTNCNNLVSIGNTNKVIQKLDNEKLCNTCIIVTTNQSIVIHFSRCEL